MNHALSEKPTGEQLLLIRGILSSRLAKRKWPDVRYLRRWLRQTSAQSDVREIMNSFPVIGERRGTGPTYSALWFNPSDHSNEAPVKLTLAAGLLTPEYDVEPYVTMIHTCARRVASASPDSAAATITSDLFYRKFNDDHVFHVASLPEVLQHEPLGLAAGIQWTGESWTITLGEVIAEYANIRDLADYVDRTIEVIEREISKNEKAQVPRNEVEVHSGKSAFVAPSLVAELEGLDETHWNTSKLVTLLRELNDNYKAGNPYASLMLYRAVIDCIPPIFECSTFSNVVNNAANIGATDKRYLKSLGEYRLAADDALHRQISRDADLVGLHYLPQPAAMDALIRLTIARLR